MEMTKHENFSWKSSAELKSIEENLLTKSNLFSKKSAGDHAKLDALKKRNDELDQLKLNPEERDISKIRKMDKGRKTPKFKATAAANAFDEYMDKIIWQNEKPNGKTMIREIEARELAREKESAISLGLEFGEDMIENKFFSDKVDDSKRAYIPNSVLAKLLHLPEPEKKKPKKVPSWMSYEPKIGNLREELLKAEEQREREEQERLEKEKAELAKRKQTSAMSFQKRLQPKLVHQEKLEIIEVEEIISETEIPQEPAKPIPKHKEPDYFSKMKDKVAERPKKTPTPVEKPKEEKKESKLPKAEPKLKQLPKIEKKKPVQSKPVSQATETIEQVVPVVQFPSFLENHKNETWLQDIMEKLPIDFHRLSKEEFVSEILAWCPPNTVPHLLKISLEAVLEYWEKLAKENNNQSWTRMEQLSKFLIEENKFQALFMKITCLLPQYLDRFLQMFSVNDSREYLKTNIFKKFSIYNSHMLQVKITEFITEWTVRFKQHIEKTKKDLVSGKPLHASTLSGKNRGGKAVELSVELSSEVTVKFSEVLNYYCEIMFENDLRVAREKEAAEQARLEAEKPITDKDAIVYPADEEIEAQMKKEQLTRLGRMHANHRLLLRNKAVPKFSNQGVLLDPVDPVKFVPNKLTLPMTRKSVFNPFQTSDFMKNIENSTYYQPIVLTIRTTRQRYFLPHNSYLMQES